MPPESGGDGGDGLAGEVDAIRARQEECESDGLRVLVGELGVSRVREQQLAPIGRQVREGAVVCLSFEGVGHLVAEQPGQGCNGGDKLGDVARRYGLPVEEVVEQPGQSVAGVGELRPGGADVAVEVDDLADALAGAVQAPVLAVGVDDVRQGRELGPLLAVVGVGLEPGWVGALAGGLDLDVAGDGAVDLAGVVGPHLQVGQGCLAHHRELHAYGLGYRCEQHLERAAHLVLGLSDGRGQPRLDGRSERGDRSCDGDDELAG